MWQFIKNIFSTIIGIFLFFAVSLGLIMALAIASAGSQEPQIADSSILKLSFSGPIKEIGEEDPFAEFGGLAGGDAFGSDAALGLKDILGAIENAQYDDRIAGIYISAGSVPAGYAMTEDIRNALLEFKASGKFIYAYNDFFTEKGYYLASVADKVFLNPQGLLEFNGIASNRMFFKKMFEKVGIKPEIFRVGDYKSAVEPFLLEKMSDASREQTLSYLNSMYGTYLSNTAASLKQEVGELENISDQMLIREAGDAVKYKLISDTLYYDQVLAELRTEMGLSEDDKINYTSLGEYVRAVGYPSSYNRNKIAVVLAEGNIVNGQGSFDNIGGDKIAKRLRKIRNDDKVKAVVLRINSPGGSALASDIMWREVLETSKVKPIIASMSDVAASGGYYMAMGCDYIVAQPNTITGSIGIFAALFDVQEMLNEKLGITTDVVSTGTLSDFGNPSDGLNEQERAIIQTMIERGYETFTSKAAQGRNMPVEQLLKVASGRVWSGKEALENGLVDELGGLNKAIQIAAERAELTDYQVKFYPKSINLFDKFFEDAPMMMRSNLAKYLIGEDLYQYRQQIENLQEMQGIQARLPYDISVE